MMSNEHLPTNVAIRRKITILSFAERIRKHFENPPPYRLRATARGRSEAPLPGYHQGQRILKWEPKVELEEGLKLSWRTSRKSSIKNRKMEKWKMEVESLELQA